MTTLLFLQTQLFHAKLVDEDPDAFPSDTAADDELLIATLYCCASKYYLNTPQFATLLRALRLDELFVHASVIDTSSESTFDILSRSDFDIAFCVESIVKELGGAAENVCF